MSLPHVRLCLKKNSFSHFSLHDVYTTKSFPMTDIYSVVASSWGLVSKIDSGVFVILAWPHCNCCLLPDWKHSSSGHRELQGCSGCLCSCWRRSPRLTSIWWTQEKGHCPRNWQVAPFSTLGSGVRKGLQLAHQGRTHGGDCPPMKGVIPATQTLLRPLQTPCHSLLALWKAKLNQRILFRSVQDVAVFLL